MPPNTVGVTRPTCWGNPFIVGCHCETAEDATQLYRGWLEGPARSIALAAKKELRGKDLACWCKEGTACHADVLLEIANK